MIRFDDLSLHPALLKAVQDAGFAAPTAIQAQAIPPILAGRDVLGCAQTGTGKTAAFVLPLVQRLAALAEPPGARARSAASSSRQRANSRPRLHRWSPISALGCGIENAVIFGGVSDVPQRRALRRGVDVVVATPGRLEDLMRAREVDLRSVEIVVLDEADRMLDAGFLVAVRRILNATPRERQTLLFSATMPPEIRTLADSVQRNAAWVAVSPVATPPAQVEQAVLFVERPDKRRLLEHLLADPAVTRALVFTRTKRGADRVAKHLSAAVERVEAIHGDRSQAQRERALASFRRGTTRVLVATDLAARGIDVEGISHVINFELPDDSESYVHRIGRTGRVAAQGVALSLCDTHERDQLARIERLMKKAIPVRREHPFTTPSAAVRGANSHSRDRSRRRSPNREHRWA